MKNPTVSKSKCEVTATEFSRLCFWSLLVLNPTQYSTSIVRQLSACRYFVYYCPESGFIFSHLYKRHRNSLLRNTCSSSLFSPPLTSLAHSVTRLPSAPDCAALSVLFSGSRMGRLRITSHTKDQLSLHFLQWCEPSDRNTHHNPFFQHKKETWLL